MSSTSEAACVQDRELTKTLTRQQLYERVWATPMRILAKEFGLSDVGLAKVCRRYEIPRPPVGYWAKLEHGKKVHKPSLHADEELDRLTIAFDLRSPCAVDEHQEAEQIQRDPDVEMAIKAVEKILPIHVPDELVHPHKFVVLTERAFLQALRSGYKDRYGLIHPWWEYRGPTLGIGVTEASIPRALRIANALLEGATAAGFAVKSVEENGHGHVRLIVLKELFVFSIGERKRQVPHVLTAEEKAEIKRYGRPFWAPKVDYVGTGDLTLSVWPSGNTYGVESWKDAKRSRLENTIGHVLLGLPLQVQHLRKAREAQKRHEIERMQAERRRWEEEKRQRDEQKRVDALLNEAEGWHKAEMVRAYIQAIDAAVQRIGREDDPDVRRWLAWAHDVADRLDPIRSIHAQDVSAAPNRPR